jgi:DNA-binding transcriptional MerR regulator
LESASEKVSEVIEKKKLKRWKNIQQSFTSELIQEWKNLGFTYEQTKNWVETSSPSQQEQAIQEPSYYAWLRDIKRVDAEWVLNHGQETDLKKEHQNHQQQLKTQIEFSPK